jgi:hypothetical protein
MPQEHFAPQRGYCDGFMAKAESNVIIYRERIIVADLKAQ